jgi:hypothetical protein
MEFSKIANLVPASTSVIIGDAIRNKFKTPEGKPKPSKKSDHPMTEVLSDLRTRAVSRNNRYMIQMIVPNALNVNFNFIDNKYVESIGSDHITDPKYASMMSAAIESANFPGFNFQSADVRYDPFNRRMPVKSDTTDFTTDFRVDGSMLEKKLFEAWASSIQDPLTGDFYYQNDYKTNIRVIQLNEEDKSVFGVVIEDAWPTMVNDLQLSAGQQNDYHRLSVQWSYHRIRPLQEFDNFFYSDQPIPKATGTKERSLLDRALGEFKKVGKGIVYQKVIKNLPVGQIPGIGSVSGGLGRLGF